MNESRTFIESYLLKDPSATNDEIIEAADEDGLEINGRHIGQTKRHMPDGWYDTAIVQNAGADAIAPKTEPGVADQVDALVKERNSMRIDLEAALAELDRINATLSKELLS